MPQVHAVSSSASAHLCQHPVPPEGHRFRVAACVLVAPPDALQVGSQLVAAVAPEQRTAQLVIRLCLLQGKACEMGVVQVVSMLTSQASLMLPVCNAACLAAQCPRSSIEPQLRNSQSRPHMQPVGVAPAAFLLQFDGGMFG